MVRGFRWGDGGLEGRLRGGDDALTFWPFTHGRCPVSPHHVRNPFFAAVGGVLSAMCFPVARRPELHRIVLQSFLFSISR